MSQTSADKNHIRFACDVMKQEADAILLASESLDDSFNTAVNLIGECRGSVIVSGVGKSGLIGAKISATLASTGTSSHFLHATDAMHGDLGRIGRNDIVLLLSYSGTTEEVLALAAILSQDHVSTISITNSKQSHLARQTTIAISTGMIQEACPFNLAPTASTASMLAIGDALALSVSRARSFTESDFHHRHPGGALGRLMTPVRDLLRFKVGQNAVVSSHQNTLREVLTNAEAYSRRCGAVMIVNDAMQLVGILTDADIRRCITQEGTSFLDLPAINVMTSTPASLHMNAPLKEAIQLIRERRIDEIPVVDDEGRPIGILDVQDLVTLRLVCETP